MKTKTLALLLLLGIAAPARAATVYLKDGSRLQGTVVSATARDIQLHTPDGLLRISADRISRIDYAESEAPPPQAPPQAPAPAPTPVPVPAPFPPRRPGRLRWRYEETPSLEDRRQAFSLNLGLAAPLSGVDFSSIGGGSGSNGGPGPLLGAQYVYYLNQRLGLGADFGFFGRGGTDSPSLVLSADTSVSGGSLLLLGVLRYALLPRGPARPYVLAGLGAHRSSTQIDATPIPGFAWSDTGTAETRRLVDGSSWGLASTLRLGMDFHYLDPAFFSFELGWLGLQGADAPATAAGRALGLSGVSGPLHVFIVGGRWGWRF